MNFADKNGKMLYDHFVGLNIITGKIGENEIAGWFGSNCEAKLTILHWLQTCITSANQLKWDEIEYKESISSNQSQTTIQQALSPILNDYPHLLNVEDNKFDIDLLEDELAINEIELDNLEEISKLQDEKFRILKEELSKLSKEETNSCSKNKLAFEDCLEIAKIADNRNVEFEKEILRRAQIYEFEESESVFLHAKGIFSHENFCKNVSAFFDHLQVKSSFNSPADIKNFDPNIDALLLRLNSSLTKNVHAKIQNVALKTALHWLEDFKVPNAPFLLTKNSVKNHVNSDLLSLEFRSKEVVSMYCNTQVDSVKCKFFHEKLCIYRDYLNALNDVKSIFDDIISFQELYKAYIDTESSFIETFSNYSHRIKAYMTDLSACASRIERYQKLFSHSSQLVLEKNTSGEQFLGDFIESNFLDVSFESLREKLFDDIDDFWHRTRILGKEITTLKDYVKSDCTEESVLIPTSIVKLFREYESELGALDATIKPLLAEITSTESTLKNDKWLKHKRLLWMYFMVEPQKVPYIIKEIEEHEKLERRRFFAQ